MGGQHQSGRLVDVVLVRREHNYCLIIVNRVVRGDDRASLINPRPRFPYRPCCLHHLAQPIYLVLTYYHHHHTHLSFTEA